MVFMARRAGSWSESVSWPGAGAPSARAPVPIQATTRTPSGDCRNSWRRNRAPGGSGDLDRAVQEGSLTAAARRLFLTQRPVSARLRRLEREVGEPLLRRSGRGVRPHRGRDVPVRPRSLPAGGGCGGSGARRPGRATGRKTRRGRDRPGGYLPPAVGSPPRAADVPQLELAIHVEGTAPLLRLLAAGQIELAVATLPVPEGRHAKRPSSTGSAVVVAPPRHPLAGRKRWSPRGWPTRSWISHKAESVTGSWWTVVFSRAGLAPPDRHGDLQSGGDQEAGAGAGWPGGCSLVAAWRREVAEGEGWRSSERAASGSNALSGLIVRRGDPPGRAPLPFRALSGCDVAGCVAAWEVPPVGHTMLTCGRWSPRAYPSRQFLPMLLAWLPQDSPDRPPAEAVLVPLRSPRTRHSRTAR